LGSGSLLAGAVSKPFELQNQSYPLRMLDGRATPSDLLFVRDHFKEPEVSLASWSLRIDGHVKRPYEINFSDLVEMESIKTEAFLECAGNAANGSAVSNGLWEGVALSLLLDAAEPLPDADSVQLQGADSGRLYPDYPELPYSQTVPIEKCRETASLVAYQYNGLALPVRNGFPARAIFPGLYGMNSVKWLRRLTVLQANERGTTFERSGMNRLYNRTRVRGGVEQITRVSSVQVKSVLAWPTNGLKLPAGRYSVWGFAWSGSAAIGKLSVSVDGGRQWCPAKLQSQAGTHAWVRWQYEWKAHPGEYALMSRAEDMQGSVQPLTRDPTRKDGYELNWCAPVICSVR
jgi:DMSO/TMAO reductase YedYZ molybdopterin-dependent catalytic subunit